MAKEQNPDAYHGNGRLSQAAGKGFLCSKVAGVAAGVACAAAIVATVTLNKNISEQSVEQAVGIAKGVIGLAATSGFIFGAVDGWTKADRAIADHDRLAHDAQQARTLIHEAINNGTITARDVSLEKS
jgi:hypothetical protein